MSHKISIRNNKTLAAILLFAIVSLNIAPLSAQQSDDQSRQTDGQTRRPRQLSENADESTKNAAPAVSTDDAAVIYLNAEKLDVNSERARGLRRAAPDFSGKRLHLVKFGGAIQPAGFEALRASGFEVVDYIPNYAYLVYGDAESVQRLRGTAAKTVENRIVWDGEYLPEFKVQPGVFTFDKETQRTRLGAERFTVQLFNDARANSGTLALLGNLRRGEFFERSEVLHYVNVTAELDADGIRAIAARPDVISIHPDLEPQKNDERQNRIVTGFVSGNGIVAGNHLDYLAAKGFAQTQFDSSNFSVNVVDDGLDAGGANAAGTPNSTTHFGLFRQGEPNAASRIVFARPYGTASLADSQGCAGHGNLNAHIIGGYVPTGGIFAAFPHADANGYRYGLGVAPFVKLGSSAIFNIAGRYTNPNLINLEAEAYRDGARVSSNSWGSNTNVYDSDAQTYDLQVRDAQPSSASVSAIGNQEYTIIFSAGNDGSGAGTVGNPGVAKNVITVGASENVHPFGGADKSGVNDSGADSLNDIINFSSRGPTGDGRRKPEIVAPGTHVTGGVYQQTLANPVSGTGDDNGCYNGSGVSGGVNSNFFPSSNQQWYTASSGTSHSTPAVAGGAALVRQYFINQNFAPPSPAMTKAVLMNAASYLTGAGANDNLWSNAQGMGLMNLERALNTVGGAALLRDQTAADQFNASGQLRTYSMTVADGAQPVRATVAWTDAPGSTTGSASVNNLDLEVVVNNQIYRGNVFAGANSATGGAADARNNAESVFFPAGTLPTGATVTVRVKATNIAGDGVPNNSDALDQDFALVASNANFNAANANAAAIANNGVTIVSENGTPANNVPDPGETITVRVPLQNYGAADSGGNVTVTLLAGGGVINPGAGENYGTLTANGAAVSRDFTFRVSPTAACGSQITLTFQLQDGAASSTFTQTYTLGSLSVTNSQNFDAVAAPALPTGWTSTATGVGTGWTTTTTHSASTPNAAFAGNPGNVGVSDLESPAWNVMAAAAAAARLDFKINYNTENGFDGAVLEIKIGTGAYQDIVAAGGSFVTGGYNRTLATTNSNPLPGRAAWTGNSGGYVQSSVNLPAAANNQTVRFRWRLGSDNGAFRFGVNLDDVQFFGAVACAAAPARTLIVNKTADTSDGACDAGDCSLREAIAAADAGDTVTFAAPTFDSPQTISINGQLTIDKNLTVTGKGANLLTVRNTAANSVVFLIGSGSTVSLSGMTITGGNNTMSAGGGIVNDVGTLTLTGVHITGNTAQRGAGIFNFNGALTMTNSTISGNTAAGYDNPNGGTSGGIENLGGTLTVTNTTISGNRVTGFNFNGGGITISSTNNVTVTNSTVTRNEAAGASSAGGVLIRTGATTAIRNSLIASNCALVFNATCGTNEPPDVGVVAGGGASFTSIGYNLIGRPGTVTNFNQTGDQTGTNAAPIDPQLFPLRANGGATPTHALRSNSTAINPASSNNAPANDQRGAPRAGNADIGAFEFLPMVTNTNDTGAGSLRQVVADVPAGGFVIFDDFFRLEARTIDLSSGQVTISKNLEIIGLGANVLTVRNTQPQNINSRVFNIQSGIVRLSGMTMTGGNVSNISTGGGGIFNLGSLTVFACHITGNTDNSSGGGGGIFNDGAALTIINSTLSGNRATGGSNSSGGIYNDGNSQLNVLNSTVSGNRATGGNSNGGGILAVGDTVISSSTVTDNETNPISGISAGGILKFNGTTVTIRNSIVAANCARTTNPLCSQSTTPDVSSFGNAYTSQGYNLIGSGGAATGFNQTGDQTGSANFAARGQSDQQFAPQAILNPQLAPLADNGGTTPTHAPLGNSPAIDRGSSFGATADQRGSTRPRDFPNSPNASGGDGADIGALELQLAPTAAAVSLSGRVLTPVGNGLMNARITLTDQNGSSRTVTTSSFGYFRFDDVSAGGTVVLSVTSKRYTFAQQVFSLAEDLSDLTFVGQSPFGQR